jgi:hypothetical protein
VNASRRTGILKYAGNVIAMMVPLVLLGIFMLPPVNLVIVPPKQVGWACVSRGRWCPGTAAWAAPRPPGTTRPRSGLARANGRGASDSPHLRRQRGVLNARTIMSVADVVGVPDIVGVPQVVDARDADTVQEAVSHVLDRCGQHGRVRRRGAADQGDRDRDRGQGGPAGIRQAAGRPPGARPEPGQGGVFGDQLVSGRAGRQRADQAVERWFTEPPVAGEVRAHRSTS